MNQEVKGLLLLQLQQLVVVVVLISQNVIRELINVKAIVVEVSFNQ